MQKKRKSFWKKALFVVVISTILKHFIPLPLLIADILGIIQFLSIITLFICICLNIAKALDLKLVEVEIRDRRPIGVKIFAYIILLSSFIFIFSLLVTYTPLIAVQRDYLPISYNRIVQIYSAIAALTNLIVGIGLLKLLMWARVFVIIKTIADLIYMAVINWFYTYQYSIPYFVDKNQILSLVAMAVSLVVTFLYALILIYYFTRPELKKQFLRGSSKGRST